MWHDMFTQQIPFDEKILRTVLVYALILVLFRMTGKRGFAGLNSLDIVVMMLLSNVVQNAIIGNDNSLLGGGIGAVTLVAVNSLLNRLTAVSPTAARLLEGTDSVVIRDGQPDRGLLRRLALRRTDLDHAVRLQSGDDLDEVDTGVLTSDGHLVLTLKQSEQSATRGDIAALHAELAEVKALLQRSDG